MLARGPDDLARGLDRAQALGAHHLNVQIGERPDRVADAVALIEAMERVAAGGQIPVRYETHRGRLTNDLLFTVRVLDALPHLPLTGDLSHYAMVHEMPLPVPEPDQRRMSRVIAQCEGYHGRVAGSHQVQVSIMAPQHQDWVAQFRAWWAEGFAGWLARAPADASLSFMTELGPPNYALTDAEGREIGDRWAESKSLKDMARQIWAEAQAAAPG
jgi:sugar phosphate isomerase/epimerase